MNRTTTQITTLDSAVAFLKRALPEADRLTLDDDALRRVARHALEVRARQPWSGTIPEDIFLAFVLFPRVNNEAPVAYHAVIWEALAPRLEGLGMTEAVQAVNRWCFEQATYQSTDGRTADALTVMRRGFGRCGEESTLLVSALRACGIPARQVYVPLWSHCDDNHAWVEAWADGDWHYLGACEPELALDSGWFTAAASKAMLVHTRAFGLLPKGERAETCTAGVWELNRTAAYAKTRLVALRVTENGAPRPGLRVDFQLANMAAYRPICRKTTDADGRVELLTGLGTLRVHITDGARYLACDVVEDAAEYPVDFGAAVEFAPGKRAFVQRPPRESRIQPTCPDAAQTAAHERWLAETERARQARFAVPEGEDPLLRDARGNRAVIEAFLADARWEEADKRALLERLRAKDLVDAAPELLADAMDGALPWKHGYPRDVWVQSVLCPRIADEPLYPFRAWAKEKQYVFRDAMDVWEALCAKGELASPGVPELTPDLRALLASGRWDARQRDLLFVALCRANGIPARLDAVTREKQYWAGDDYHPLLPGRAADACLTLKNRTSRALTAGEQFSVSRLENGAFHPLRLYGIRLEEAHSLPLPAGRYRVMTASRAIDGRLEGFTEDLELASGETRAVNLTLPEDDTPALLLRAALPPLQALDAGRAIELPNALAGQPAIIALVAPGQEPTEHFLNELLDAAPALSQRNIAVRLLLRDEKGLENAKLRRVLSELPDAACLLSPDETTLLRWRELMNAGELRLPLSVAVGRRGEGLFAFVNYNVGAVTTLIKVIDAE